MDMLRATQLKQSTIYEFQTGTANTRVLKLPVTKRGIQNGMKGSLSSFFVLHLQFN